MTVLVTGGAGYIGSHTAKFLAQAGIEPVVLDNLSAGHLWAVRWGPFVQGDLEDIDLLREVMRAYQIQAVMHFAAHAYVGESMLHPRKYFRNNVVNTLNLLDVVVEAKVQHFIFSSTCATYGVPQETPIREQHAQAPVNPYGEAKLFVERVLNWYGHCYGLRWAALRYFNAAGSDPEGQLGEQHDPEPHLIPQVIRAATGETPFVEIFGTDYATPDGTAIRDYTHVTDLAAAHYLALTNILNGGKSAAFNLGTGTGYSVREVIAAVERSTGCPVPVREAQRRPGDPPCLVADATCAKQVLHWRPSHSSLDEIVGTAWQWRATRSRVPALVCPMPIHRKKSEEAWT